jgi:hypothetical protein
VLKLFENASFIIFNYDRCLEQFLVNALPRLYAISETEADSIVHNINIIHPYGSVGELGRIASRSGLHPVRLTPA